MVIQPGGSIKDNEVIDACNEYNISMVLLKPDVSNIKFL